MTGSYFERSALKSYMKIPCKFLVAKLSSFQQFLVSSLREALSYLLENQMSHASHASHTSHPLAPFSSRYALHQATMKAALSAPRLNDALKLLVNSSRAKPLPCAKHPLNQAELRDGWRWCCTGRQMRRSKAKLSEGSRAVEDERTSEAKWPQGAAKEGTAFRRIRSPIAQQSRADRPLTGAANECRLKGGTRKHHRHPSPCGALLATFFKQCGSGGCFSLAQGVCGCGRLAQPLNLHCHGHHRSMRRTLYGIDRIYRLP